MPSKNLCHNLSVCSGFVNFATSKSGGSCRRRQGEMVEWSITPVLKTGIRRRIGGSNPSLSAINIENQCFTKLTPDFTPENVKSGVFCLRLTIDIGAGGSLPKVVTHRLEVDTYFTDLYSARSKGVIKNASKLIR